jgi:hypothetical protein
LNKIEVVCATLTRFQTGEQKAKINIREYNMRAHRSSDQKEEASFLNKGEEQNAFGGG